MLVELIALAIVLEKGSADEICYSLMTAVSQVDNLVFALTDNPFFYFGAKCLSVLVLCPRIFPTLIMQG
jgi:hypothetical protein